MYLAQSSDRLLHDAMDETLVFIERTLRDLEDVPIKSNNNFEVQYSKISIIGGLDLS